MSLSWEIFKPVLQIVAIDVVLSGDNAVVIAMAAYRLPPVQRRIAILCGAAGAIGLRVLLTFVLAQLLNMPLLQFLGGLVLIWISIKLSLEGETGEGPQVRAAASLTQAIRTIVLADFLMSLDNMLAVAGASEGHFTLILFGLLLSIAFIMTSSALIATLMSRYPVLVIIGAGVLALTAGEMMVKDDQVAKFVVTRTHHCMLGDWHRHFPDWFPAEQPVLEHRHWIGWAFVWAVVGCVVICPYAWQLLQRRRRKVKSESASRKAHDH